MAYFELINEHHNNIKTAVYDDLTHFNNFISTNSHNLKIMNINIRSLKKNFLDLCIFLQSLSDKPDILILTETWLDHNI